MCGERAAGGRCTSCNCKDESPTGAACIAPHQITLNIPLKLACNGETFVPVNPYTALAAQHRGRHWLDQVEVGKEARALLGCSADLTATARRCLRTVRCTAKACHASAQAPCPAAPLQAQPCMCYKLNLAGMRQSSLAQQHPAPPVIIRARCTAKAWDASAQEPCPAAPHRPTCDLQGALAAVQHGSSGGVGGTAQQLACGPALTEIAHNMRVRYCTA